MRLVLDASVLFPTVMRRLLMVSAAAGAFEPIWSERLLEEWRRAVVRQFPQSADMVGVEIALLQSRWPGAMRPVPQDLEKYWLPDLDDRHVLGLAITSSSDGIVTSNAKDFPRGLLAEDGLQRFDPDTLLANFANQDAALHAALGAEIATIAADFPDRTVRNILKKARLPKMGKRFRL